MKAIMYHYVRPKRAGPPDYYYLDIEDFRRQLDYLQSTYGIVDRDTFLNAMRGNRPVPDEGVVLTFDDGLLDHYQFVYPELLERDLWGIFYVPTGPFVSGELLHVHKIHYLLGRHGGETLRDELRSIVTEEVVSDQKIEEFRRETYRAQDTDERAKSIKRLLNYYVADEHRSDVMDRLDRRLPGTFPAVSEFYLQPTHLREMQTDGFVIGSHTVTHPVLSNQSPQTQIDEIESSFDFLDTALDGVSVQTFCYPYGGSHTYTEATVSMLESVGCVFSFSVESADITTGTVTHRAQTLPRYDCNTFRYGDAAGGL